MLIELLDSETKGKYQFDDKGIVAVQIMPDSLTAIRWDRDDTNSGEPPMIPTGVLERWKAVRARSLAGTTSPVAAKSSLVV